VGRCSQTALRSLGLLSVLNRAFGFRQLFLVFWRQLRRLDQDGQLVDLAGELERHLIILVIHRRAGVGPDTVTIDGAPYDHLFFFQPPGIELELCLSNNEQSLPRRLIVTDQLLPGQPNFITEFSDWNFDIHPSDAEFVFQPPADAVQTALKLARETASKAKEARNAAASTNYDPAPYYRPYACWPASLSATPPPIPEMA
jgi:Predicted periplasmic protein (DUF2092)